MSLLSRERLVAVLAPTHVAVLSRARRGALQALDSVECAPARAGMHDWSAAADTLAQTLAGRAARRGELTVVLSSHFVRFRLVAWSDAVGSPDEMEAYARIGFEDVYGAVVAGWALRVSPEGPGCARLAAAIEQALLDRLEAVAHTAGLRLASVEPHLAASFNRLLPRLRHQDFVFAVTEPGRCSLLVARAGRWLSVRSSAAQDPGDALAAMLARECELCDFTGDMPPAVYVHAAGGDPAALVVVQGMAAQALELGPPGDAWTGMAQVAA